ncbi:uncharacterized protein [Clytia hemisphaerica]|uniref:Uncharacterized protein n=1 Tax=Clytia hemisphaerica TaxID=252671 RepID=A0A7M5V6Q4_9CNID
MVPNKRQRLADAATTCSPVKMKNFNSAPNGKIWINPPTSINLLKREEADFEHNAALGDDVIVPFADLHHLASGQIISVKAQCHSVGEVHDHQGKQGTVLKQVVLLRDSTRCIQLYLFGDSVNTLDEGKTYILKNVRVYIMKNVMYLNTTLTATFGYTLTTSFETLADPDVHTNIKIVAKIIGVGQFLSSYLCPDCNRKLSLVDDTYHCGSCKMGYSQGSCSNIYSLQLSLKDVANNEIVKVYLQHDAVCMLAAELSLNLKNDKECVKRLFEVNEPMLVTFDFASKCVKSIKIAIESD